MQYGKSISRGRAKIDSGSSSPPRKIQKPGTPTSEVKDPVILTKKDKSKDKKKRLRAKGPENQQSSIETFLLDSGNKSQFALKK